MAPSPKKIEQALLDGTSEVYNESPGDTTVNKVRKHVEEKLGLEDGFFSTGNWKSKSKALIKDRVDQLLSEINESDSNAGSKRRSSASAAPKPKRQKRAPKPKKPTKKVESDLSEFSELSGLSEEVKPQLKKKAATAPKSKLAESNEEDDLIQSDVENSEAKDKAEDKAQEGQEDLASEKGEKSPPRARVMPTITLGEEIKDEVTEVPKGVDRQPAEEEEEYSDVIDEPVKPKRKKKETKEKKEKKQVSGKSNKPTKTAAKRTSTSEDPQEAEIKKLQSHLIKCGMRKLWHNELKQYGDDARAKIRHLKKMLSDIGMDGRFSEAKAREIKETRELMAEAESAQEMNRLWGVGGPGRASRSKSNAIRGHQSEASDEDGDDVGDGKNDDAGESGDEDGDVSYAARRRRAHADLAFLGDDSDSD